MSRIKKFILWNIAVWVFVLAACAMLPGSRVGLFQEDGLIENLSATAFLVTFVLGMHAAINLPTKEKFPWIIAGLSLVCFLSELSFGERLLNLKMPRYDGVKFDAPHDVLFWGKERMMVIASTNTALFTAWIGMAAGLLILALIMYRRRIQLFMLRASNEEKHLFMGLFIVLVGLATLIDLEFIDSMIFYDMEELLEFSAGLALFVCVLCCFKPIAATSPLDVAVILKIIDGAAVYTACLVASWIRFQSGWIPQQYNPPPPFLNYVLGSVGVTAIMLVIIHIWPAPRRNRLILGDKAMWMGLLCVMALIPLLGPNYLPSRVVLALGWVLIPAFLAMGRFGAARFGLTVCFKGEANQETRLDLSNTDTNKPPIS